LIAALVGCAEGKQRTFTAQIPLSKISDPPPQRTRIKFVDRYCGRLDWLPTRRTRACHARGRVEGWAQSSMQTMTTWSAIDKDGATG
jgi:hypothetical protein